METIGFYRKVIGFYGVKGQYGGFSNFYKTNFVVRGQSFCCSEQYIMYEKSLLFRDNEIAAQILASTNPAYIKKLGRQVRNYHDYVWRMHRVDWCEPGLLAKFSQNDYLKNLLLGTDDAILAECSPYDRIWGIGLAIDDPRVQDPSMWRGENLLGRMLMDVRHQLRMGNF